MAGVKLLNVGAQNVVLISLANCDQQQTIDVIEEAARLISSQPPKSVITITQVEGAHFSPRTVKAVHDLASKDDPFVTAGIVVGVSGVRKAVFDSVVRLTRRRLWAFKSMEEARTWLSARVRNGRAVAETLANSGI